MIYEIKIGQETFNITAAEIMAVIEHATELYSSEYDEIKASLEKLIESKKQTMPDLEAIVQNVAKANGNVSTDLYTVGELTAISNIVVGNIAGWLQRSGYVTKDNIDTYIFQYISDTEIPLMPYGHALLSDVRNRLNGLYTSTSNAYTL